jgi:hypothetical protein
MNKKKKILINSFVVIYNLLSLIALFGCYPEDLFYCKYNIFILFLTFPISCFSLIYRYSQSEPIYPVFIIQAIMFIASWLLIMKPINNKK